ncbi:MAG: type II toxin-antitoxin system Phd/YefM family antitoxin [Terriglobales bacterium]
MGSVGLFEAKQKLSELVERARSGEEIGITRHGKLVARLVPAAPAQPAVTWKQAFEYLDEYRKHAKLMRNPPIKELINEGRR